MTAKYKRLLNELGFLQGWSIMAIIILIVIISMLLIQLNYGIEFFEVI